MKVQANGIAIEVEDTGEAARPAVLLVMGLGMQLVAWPDAFVDTLHREGFRVVRFDNRDAGLSQSFHHLGVPNLVLESLKHRFGLRVNAPYTVRDMAADTLGVLDALRIAAAHVVGVSMGGMIAQRLALAAPQRAGPPPRPAGRRALRRRPRARDEDAIVEHLMGFLRVIGSPGFPTDDAQLRTRVRLATRRAFNPAGTIRQMTAVAADTARAAELPRLRLPTLVVHGQSDPLVPFACGQDTARRIPGARLLPVPGMGHDLPPGVVERLLEALLPHLRQTAAQ